MRSSVFENSVREPGAVRSTMTHNRQHVSVVGVQSAVMGMSRSIANEGLKMVKTSSIVITARKSSMAPIVCALKVTCCLPELGSGRIRPRSKRILREQISLMMWGAIGDSANRFLAVVLAFCSLSLCLFCMHQKDEEKKKKHLDCHLCI